jgi:predicted membrane-bound dolichyl-phosphate-mannose-protein mannosyltransferase
MEKLHVQPAELDMLPYYEYEYTVEIYNDIVKERNDEEKKQNRGAEDKYNVSGIQKNMSKNISSYKNPTMPKISMPRF